MSPELVMSIGRTAMEVTLTVGAPLLLVSLSVGLIVSIFQTVTQINEATLTFIPKLIAVLVTLIIAGPWMMSIMVDYMTRSFTNFQFLNG